MEIRELFECRKTALKNKDLNKLCECAVEMVRHFPGWYDSHGYYLLEAAFFLGRINNMEQFEELVKLSYEKSNSFYGDNCTTKEKIIMFDLGRRYPFLDDDELSFLEALYCSSGTYNMINRMLFDQNEVLPRKLARFDESLFSIRNENFPQKLCLDVFKAMIINEMEYNIQDVIEERYESWYKRIEKGYDMDDCYSPILVYNRRTNTIQLDKTDLSDKLLFPIYDFQYANINMSDLIDLVHKNFGDEVIHKFVNPILEKLDIISDIESCVFCFNWFLSIETAIIRGLSLQSDDYRLLDIHEQIAKKWLTYQNEKTLS